MTNDLTYKCNAATPLPTQKSDRKEDTSFRTVAHGGHFHLAKILRKKKQIKITTFNPLIFTKDAKPLIELFEALGFERTHTKEDIDSENTTDFRMKDANGFHVDITQTDKVAEDRCSIRMNVDNFDETIKKLEEHGFKSYQGNSPVDTGSSTVTLMKSPSGFSISVSEHKK